MLTPAHKSQKKRQTQALLLILRLGTLPAVVVISQTFNCGHEWLCDYCGNSSTSRTSCLPYCVVADSKWNLWGLSLPDVGAKPYRSHNAADSIQWILGVSIITKHLERAHSMKLKDGGDCCNKVKLAAWLTLKTAVAAALGFVSAKSSHGVCC